MPKIKGEKRNREVKIRLTEQEFEELHARKTKSLAAWLRDLGLGAMPIRQADPDLIRQIACIGSNLNQIARQANTQKTVDREILRALEQCQQRLTEIIELHTTS